MSNSNAQFVSSNFAHFLLDSAGENPHEMMHTEDVGIKTKVETNPENDLTAEIGNVEAFLKGHDEKSTSCLI